jgi:hypothetical protein
MTTRLLLAVAAALLTALATLAAGPALVQAAALPGIHLAAAARATSQQVASTGTPLSAFGSRGPTGALSPKLDGALADLARHISRVRPGHELADLRSLNPGARFVQPQPGEPPRVLVDAVTRGDPQQLRAALTGLGLTGATVYANDVGGWLPVSQLAAAAARAEVHSVRAALPHTRAGAVTSQGDFAQRSDVVRASSGLDGTGITVGVLSDSFNCYQTYAADGVSASGLTGYAYNGFIADAPTDVSTGDLPANVKVLKDIDCMSYTQYSPAILPFTDEGRAMLQVVHDVAPGAALAFYTADNSEADFANGIQALARAGAQVIADDVGYYDEPFFQDGLIAQAVDAVKAQGVSYFSAAGNDGQNSYETTAPSFGAPATSGPNQGEKLLNFDFTGATTTTALPITISKLYPGEYLALVVEWDQPYVTGAPGSPGASSRIDVCVSGAGGDGIYDLDGKRATCTGPNAAGQDPVQVLLIGNPATASADTASQALQVTIGLAGGPAPGRIKFVLEDNGGGSTIDKFDTQSSTLQGHPGAAGAAAVGAAYYFHTPRCGTTPAQLESYSSEGGAPILFDTSGARLATPVTRQKPDFVGPDGVDNTFLGLQLGITGNPATPTSTITACQDSTASAALGVYPSFFGTSAATPHAAGIAALLRQSVSSATPDEIYQALRSTALPMSNSAPDVNAGHGFIEADAALAALQSSTSSSSSSSSSSAGQPAGSGGGGGAMGLFTPLGLGALVGWQLLRRRRGSAGSASS